MRLPTISLILCHVLIHLSTGLVHYRESAFDDLSAVAPLLILAALLPAFVIPRLFDRAPAAAPAIGQEPLPYLAILLFLASALLGRIGGADGWLDSRLAFCAVAIGNTFIIPVTYYIFFSRSNPATRGLWFATSFAIGLLCEFFRDFFVRSVFPDPAHRLSVGFTIITCATVLHAIVTLAAYIHCIPKQTRRTYPDDAGASAEAPRLLRRLALAYALFFIVNGFSASQLYSLSRHVSPAQAAFTLVLLPAVGRLMDREAATWLGRLLLAGAFAMLFTPSLAVVDHGTLLREGIGAAIALAHLVVLVVMTVSFDRLAGAAPYWLLWVGLPYTGRFLTLPVSAIVAGLHLDDGDHSDTLVVAGILVSAVIYHLCHDLGRRAARPGLVAGPVGIVGSAESAETPETAGTATPAASTASADADRGRPRSRQSEIFMNHKLSARETDVAKLLLKGKTTAEIAQTLFISDSTVNFHTKNILRKFDVGSRLALVAKIVASIDPDPDPEPEPEQE